MLQKLVEDISRSVGFQESGIKLLLAIYAGYITAMFHRIFLYKRSINLQCVLLTAISLPWLFWAFGFGMMHAVLCTFTQWLLLKLYGGSAFCAAFSFAFQLGYLVVGYAFLHSEGDYVVDWTMPHCVLTLRLIGLAIDKYDDRQAKNRLSSAEPNNAVTDLQTEGCPSLVEIFGFAFFYPGCIVGPQFSFKRFRSVLNGELTDVPGQKPQSLLPGFRRCLSGSIMLAIQAYLDSIFNSYFYTTPQFQASSFAYKAGYIAITGHVLFLRYVAVWMINEGTGIICGLGFTRDKETGQVQWDAMRNVKLHKFLTACSFQDLINSFNINTNGWVLRYVFKRMRFVGIRAVSQACAMYFLAIWHGTHMGYFTCFTYESLTMSVEKQLMKMADRSPLVQNMRSHPILRFIPKAVGFAYMHILMGYALIDFALLKWSVYQPVYASVHYYGHVFYGTFFIVLWIKSLVFGEPVDHRKRE